MSSPLPIAVLVSGSGTNLQAIIDQQEAGNLPVEIKVVICNRKKAYAIERAKKHGIPVEYVSHLNFESREAFDQEIHRLLESLGVKLVVLAGFMRLLSPWFVERWYLRLINIHPALCPSFPGVHAQKQAFDYGVKVTGCTVFFVDSGVDTGPIIIQAVVSVLPDDTEDSLAERILKEEHWILPQAIDWIANNALEVKERRVIAPVIPHEELRAKWQLS